MWAQALQVVKVQLWALAALAAVGVTVPSPVLTAFPYSLFCNGLLTASGVADNKSAT